jgi:conjugative transposon TraK protein
MFQQMKNIDSAFRQIRLFCLLTIIVSCAVSVLCIFKSYQFVHNSQQKIFILANGKALEAYSAERKDNIPVEAKDHIRMFHHHFFTLDPDDEVIRSNVTRALYLADGTAKRQYDDLKEKGYYANLISGNISQQIQADSITVDMDSYPYHFRYYGTQTLTRATSITTRSLITEGYLRNVSRSDNNPHGFLIEKWSTLQNGDIQTKNR